MFINVFITAGRSVGTNKRTLVYKQIMTDDIVQQSYNNIKYVFIGQILIADKYYKLTLKLHTTTL